MGEEGCHRLRCARRGARASFLPGSGTRTRRKQVNSLAKTIESAWKIEATRLITAIAQVTYDIGIAEELPRTPW
jgi:hypothetical protein